MDIKDAAISLGISYIANNVPVVNEFLKKHNGLDKELSDCYQKAVNNWKCAAVRDKYQGNSLMHIDQLKSYVQGKNVNNIPDELKELFAMWTNEIRQNEKCYHALLEWKIDGVLSSINGGEELARSIASHPIFMEIKQDVSKISQDVSNIQAGVELIIDEMASNQSKSFVQINIDGILERYFSSLDATSIIVEPIPVCANKQDTLIALYNLVIEIQSTLDHYIYFLCCRGGLSWYSNPGRPEFLGKVFAKIEKFANVNRYYMSEDLYSKLRQHINAGQDVISEFQTFVVILESTCEKHDEQVLDVFDAYTYGIDGIKIDNNFVSVIMNAFYNIEHNQAFISFAKTYEQFLNGTFRLMEIAKG